MGADEELRTASLSAPAVGAQIPAAQGYVSGACGFRQPLSPSAANGGVAFLLARSPCDTLQTTLAEAPGTGSVLGARPAGAFVLGAAFDAGRVYWLRGAASPDPIAETAARVPCANPATACRLVLSGDLPLTTASRPRR